MSEFDLAEWKQRRNKALADLDIEYARREVMPHALDEVILMALHKSRYECTEIEPALRHASREWLEKNNLGRYAGLPWPPKDELPA